MHAALATPSLRPSDVAVNSVGFSDSSDGWALSNQSVYATNDAGDSWQKEKLDAAGQVLGADFISRDVGFVATTNATQALVTVSRTEDRGATWESATLQDTFPNAGQPAYFSFIDAQDGWMTISPQHSQAVAGSVLYGTKNGGKSWEAVNKRNQLFGPIRFTSPSTGWAVGGSGGSQLLVTHDGGVTFAPVSLPVPAEFEDSGQIVGLPVFAGDDAVDRLSLATDTQGQAVFDESSDGGGTWELSKEPPAAPSDHSPGEAPFSVPDAHTWLLLLHGQLLSTRDAGQSWANVLANVSLSNVILLDFETPKEGWALTSGGVLLRSMDGGETWVADNPGSGNGQSPEPSISAGG